jgi:excinuclease ABC subunit A
MVQLDGLVEAGNTVIVIEHEMRVVAGSDWVIDIGPGAGEDGGHVVAEGPPAEVAHARGSRTAPYLARFIEDSTKAARRSMSRDRRTGVTPSAETGMSSVA